MHQHVGLTELAEMLATASWNVPPTANNLVNGSFWERDEALVLYCHAKICQSSFVKLLDQRVGAEL